MGLIDKDQYFVNLESRFLVKQVMEAKDPLKDNVIVGALNLIKTMPSSPKVKTNDLELWWHNKKIGALSFFFKDYCANFETAVKKINDFAQELLQDYSLVQTELEGNYDQSDSLSIQYQTQINLEKNKSNSLRRRLMKNIFSVFSRNKVPNLNQSKISSEQEQLKKLTESQNKLNKVIKAREEYAESKIKDLRLFQRIIPVNSKPDSLSNRIKMTIENPDKSKAKNEIVGLLRGVRIDLTNERLSHSKRKSMNITTQFSKDLMRSTYCFNNMHFDADEIIGKDPAKNLKNATDKAYDFCEKTQKAFGKQEFTNLTLILNQASSAGITTKLFKENPDRFVTGGKTTYTAKEEGNLVIATIKTTFRLGLLEEPENEDDVKEIQVLRTIKISKDELKKSFISTPGFKTADIPKLTVTDHYGPVTKRMPKAKESGKPIA